MSEVTEILRLRCRRAARTSLSAQDDKTLAMTVRTPGVPWDRGFPRLRCTPEGSLEFYRCGVGTLADVCGGRQGWRTGDGRL